MQIEYLDERHKIIRTIEAESGVPFKYDGFDWEFAVVLQTDGAYNVSHVTSGLNLATGSNFDKAVENGRLKLAAKTPAQHARAQLLIDQHIAKMNDIKFREALRILES